MQQYEIKVLPLEMKVNVDDGTFEGYCAGYGNIDSYDDRLLANSHEQTIVDNPEQVKVYVEHGWYEGQLPVGKALSFEGREEGLYTQGKVLPTSLGKDVIMLMKDKVMTGLSIGWMPLDFKYLKEGDKHIREVSRYELREYSIVSWGANDFAKISGVKGRVGVRYDFFSVLEDAKDKIEGQALYVTGDAIEPKDFAAMRERFRKSDPVGILLDEAAYLHEMARELKAEGREDEIREALGELDQATLLLSALCVAEEIEPERGDIVALLRKTTQNIHEVTQAVSSLR